jgi:hypothetical protein
VLTVPCAAAAQELHEARRAGIRTLGDAEEFEVERKKKAGQDGGAAGGAAAFGSLPAPLGVTAPAGEWGPLCCPACTVVTLPIWCHRIVNAFGMPLRQRGTS